MAFLQYAHRFFRPISDMSEKFNIFQAAMASSERIFALLDTPVEISSPAVPVAPMPDAQSGIAFEQWMMMDLEYVHTWSLKRDIMILLRTIPAVLSMRGAA